MRVKIDWLRELVDLKNIKDEELINQMSLKCIEVENVDKVADGTSLVVGKILSRVKHPDSDHLSVCVVNVGDKDLQIVCGAPNVDMGQTVIVALEGATLPGGIKIKHSKIRGVESSGMICSLQELGIEKKYVPEEYQNGIYNFNEEIAPGTDALKALGLNDKVIELGLTPNRNDLLNMIGVSIDISAAFKRERKAPTYSASLKNGDKVEVKLDTDKCLSYYAMVVKNVVIKPSPEWLKSRLISFGCRSINNVVDITNYVLALYGQPLHAFDYEKLGNKIVVRMAKENEEMETLDNIKRTLNEGDILITDGKKAVALGGVMGGLDTEVTKETTSLVIEAAVFDQNSIRETSSRLGLRSEASLRYEKGIDLNRTKEALEYTAYLLETLADATCYIPCHEGIEKIEDTKIEITKDDINNYLGLNISLEEIIDIFKWLEFKVVNNPLTVYVPHRRSDISIKADLIEEIIRMYGYDKLSSTLPASAIGGYYSKVQIRRNLIRDTLIGLGLNETVTYTLVSENHNQTFTYNHQESSSNIELLMPLTSDHKVLRKGLIPSLIDVCCYNSARKMKDVNIFEIGKAYYLKNNEYNEEETLGILMTNEFSNTLWQGKLEKVDFYLIKGIAEELFNKLGLKAEYLSLEDAKDMHPRRSAKIIINNEVVGFIGEVHPAYLNEVNLKDVYVLEIKLDKILNTEKEITHFTQISKTPNMERDLALVVKEDIPASKIIDTIKKTERKLLSNVKIFDLYTGEKLASGYKSIAVKLTFTSNDPLTDEIVNQKVDKILKVLNKELEITIRTI